MWGIINSIRLICASVQSRIPCITLSLTSIVITVRGISIISDYKCRSCMTWILLSLHHSVNVSPISLVIFAYVRIPESTISLAVTLPGTSRKVQSIIWAIVVPPVPVTMFPRFPCNHICDPHIPRPLCLPRLAPPEFSLFLICSWAARQVRYSVHCLPLHLRPREDLVVKWCYLCRITTLSLGDF